MNRSHAGPTTGRLKSSPARIACVLAGLVALAGCNRSGFPDVPAGYREFAYVADSGSNTVTVLDLVYLRQDRTIEVGANPIALAASPTRDEVYAVSTQGSPRSATDGSVAILDASQNKLVTRVAVHRAPSSIDVSADGHRAYVTNSGANTVSVLDLDNRRELGTVGTGEEPGLARISHDMRTLVVSNRGSGSVSIFDVAPFAPAAGQPAAPLLKLRATFDHCPGASDIAIMNPKDDTSKAFVTCSASNQVLAIQLASEPGSWPAKQDPNSLTDHLLTFLEVGKSPVHVALKPDMGEVFVSNFASNSISEISTRTNDVLGTYMVGNEPAAGIVQKDGSVLWTADFSSDTISLYSIDDGRVLTVIHTGSQPRALAFSADEHLLLATDTRSGDVTVVRTNGQSGRQPGLFTLLPAGRAPTAIVTKVVSSK